MDREQKIEFLQRLKGGQADLKELKELEPFGWIFKVGNTYHHRSGVMNEEEFIAFMKPYTECTRTINGLPIIYGSILISDPEEYNQLKSKI